MAIIPVGCAAPDSENIIQMNEIKITDDLKRLSVSVESCGQFSGLWAYVGSTYAEGDGSRENAVDLTEYIVNSDGSKNNEIIYEFTIEQLYQNVEYSLRPEVIDTFIAIEIEVERCWSVDPLTGDMILDACTTGNNDNTATRQVQTAIVSVASYAKIYPCLAYKILTLEQDCTACNELDDVLTLDLLIKAVTLYSTYERVAEAWYAYDKATKLCQDYEDTFRIGASACDTWGGVGCWIVNGEPTGFIVSPTYRT